MLAVLRDQLLKPLAVVSGRRCHSDMDKVRWCLTGSEGIVSPSRVFRFVSNNFFQPTVHCSCLRRLRYRQPGVSGVIIQYPIPSQGFSVKWALEIFQEAARMIVGVDIIGKTENSGV